MMPLYALVEMPNSRRKCTREQSILPLWVARRMVSPARRRQFPLYGTIVSDLQCRLCRNMRDAYISGSVALRAYLPLRLGILTLRVHILRKVGSLQSSTVAPVAPSLIRIEQRDDYTRLRSCSCHMFFVETRWLI